MPLVRSRVRRDRRRNLAEGGYNHRQEAAISTVKARFDGRVFVPVGPVELPVGCELEIVLPEAGSKEPAGPGLSELADLMAQDPENPGGRLTVPPSMTTTFMACRKKP
jgi:hypothetical protein